MEFHSLLSSFRTHTHGGFGRSIGEERFCACDVAFEPLSPDGLKLETEKHASVNSAKFNSLGEKTPKTNQNNIISHEGGASLPDSTPEMDTHALVVLRSLIPGCR